jgi:hypothetical protein
MLSRSILFVTVLVEFSGLGCGGRSIVVPLSEMSGSGLSGEAQMQDAAGKSLSSRIDSFVKLSGPSVESLPLGGALYRGNCDALGEFYSGYVFINRFANDGKGLMWDILASGNLDSVGGGKFAFVVDQGEGLPGVGGPTVRHVACGSVP